MNIPKILFLIDVLYSTYGGAEGVLWRVTRRLPKDRYQCAIATFASEPDRVVAGDFDCPVYLFPIDRTYDWNALQMAIGLGRLIRSERFSMVHSFFPASDLLGGLVTKLSGCPVMISSRRDMGFQRTPFQHVAYRVCRGLYDQVQTVGEQVRAEHIRLDHLDPAKVVTVYNGIDLEQIDRTPPVASIPILGEVESGHLVVTVANIRRIKALDVLVRSAALVCREDPLARFLVAGSVNDPDYFKHLMRLSRMLGVEDKIVFCGQQSCVPSLLKRADVFCLLSRSEGLSNALLEAMACSLPCVVTGVGGNPELVEHGRSGLVVPSDDVAGSAQSILSLIRDRGLATAMGREGRRIVEAKFTLDRMINRMMDCYDLLLRKPAAGIAPDLKSIVGKWSA